MLALRSTLGLIWWWLVSFVNPVGFEEGSAIFSASLRNIDDPSMNTANLMSPQPTRGKLEIGGRVSSTAAMCPLLHGKICADIPLTISHASLTAGSVKSAVYAPRLC